MCNPGDQKSDEETENSSLLASQNRNGDKSESSRDEDRPDGGYGWVVVAASFFCNMVLDGTGYSFGVVLEPMREELNVSSGSISFVGSILAGTILLSGPISASCCNRFGTRLTTITGAILGGLGLFSSSFANSLYMLILSYGVLGGFGLGLMYVPAVVCVSQYFTKRLSLATGISVCGSGAGTFLFAPFSAKMVELYGWRGCNRALAVFSFVCILCGFLLVPRKSANQPGEAEEKKSFDFSILKNFKFTLVCLANIPTVMATYATYSYLPVIAMARGLPAVHASYLISAVGITNTLGRIICGGLADLPKSCPILMTFVAGVTGGTLAALFALCTSLPGFVLTSCAFGLMISAIPSVTSALLVKILSLHQLNSAFGALTFMRGIAALIGPPVSGYILDHSGANEPSFYVSGGLFALAGLVHGAVYLLHRRAASNSHQYQQL